MKQPLISFIVPVYNDEMNIARCIISIRSQFESEEMYQLLVLDNGSTDRTTDILQELGVQFSQISNVNVSELRNRGASLSQSEILGFVDSDVELSPGWFENGLQGFQDSNLVACGCFPSIPNESTWVQRTWDIHQRGRQQFSVPTPVPWLPSMNLMVRRDAFLKINGFNEKLETAEDVDMCYRLGKYGNILWNSDMEAIHWGEARTLAIFWKKEVWRGMGNVSGIFAHGWRWDELPSIGFPVFSLVFGICSLVALSYDFSQGEGFWLPLSLGIWSLPALLLSIHTVIKAKKWGAAPQLLLLYFIYGVARAYALIKPKKQRGEILGTAIKIPS